MTWLLETVGCHICNIVWDQDVSDVLFKLEIRTFLVLSRRDVKDDW